METQRLARFCARVCSLSPELSETDSSAPDPDGYVRVRLGLSKRGATTIASGLRPGACPRALERLIRDTIEDGSEGGEKVWVEYVEDGTYRRSMSATLRVPGDETEDVDPKDHGAVMANANVQVLKGVLRMYQSERELNARMTAQMLEASETRGYMAAQLEIADDRIEAAATQQASPLQEAARDVVPLLTQVVATHLANRAGQAPAPTPTPAPTEEEAPELQAIRTAAGHLDGLLELLEGEDAGELLAHEAVASRTAALFEKYMALAT